MLDSFLAFLLMFLFVLNVFFIFRKGDNDNGWIRLWLKRKTIEEKKKNEALEQRA